jgi:predicted PurR-regulated permease PerM
VTEPKRVELRVSFATMIKVALFLLVVFLLIELVSILVAIAFAIQIAVVLQPLHQWLSARTKPAISLALIGALMLALVIAVIVIVVPRTANELSGLVKEMPRISKSVSQRAPALAPYVDALSAEVARPPHPSKVRQWVTRGLVVGEYVLGGATTLLFVLILALYFMSEGREALAWLLSFAPEPQREKLARTVSEVRPVVFAYMKGQLITSSASFAVAFVALLVAGVPAALPLAILSFVGDFVPVVGFIVSTIPAVLLALLKGPGAAAIVLGAYLAYQAFESWVLIPLVYGKAMRLSTLTVLVAIAVGGTLGGPLGAVLILPIVAAYPVVERIWLRERLAPGTVEKHEAIEEGSERERKQTVGEMLDHE